MLVVQTHLEITEICKLSLGDVVYKNPQ